MDRVSNEQVSYGEQLLPDLGNTILKENAMQITIYCGCDATELFLALIGEYGQYFYIRNNAITTDDAFVVQNAIAFCRGYMKGRK